MAIAIPVIEGIEVAAPVIATEGAALGTAAISEGSAGLSAASTAAASTASGLAAKAAQFRQTARSATSNTISSINNHPTIVDTKNQLKQTAKDTHTAVVTGIATGIATGITNAATSVADFVTKPFTSSTSSATKTGGYYRSNFMNQNIYGGNRSVRYGGSIKSFISSNLIIIISVMILLIVALGYYFWIYKPNKSKLSNSINWSNGMSYIKNNK